MRAPFCLSSQGGGHSTLFKEDARHLVDHERIAGLIKKKVGFLEHSLTGYFPLSAMAGVYFGFGMALIVSVAGGLFVGGRYWLVSPYRVVEADAATASAPVSSVVASL